MRVWSVGEVLWDVFADHEQLGGAPLNFCANLQRLGDDAFLISAVGRDARGRLALERMQALGLDTTTVRVVEELPTGVATVRTDDEGEVSFVIPRPAAFDRVSIEPERIEKAQADGVDWIYFGTLLHTETLMERFTENLVSRLQPARCFYDVNLRTGQWSLGLVQRLSHLASMVKLNESEAETLFALTAPAGAAFSLEAFCSLWAETYGVDVLCVTLGPEGCLVFDRGNVQRVTGYRVSVGDTVGAGDAFAAAFLHGYTRGWPTLRTARFANALGALVASRAGATPDWTTDEVMALVNAESAAAS